MSSVHEALWIIVLVWMYGAGPCNSGARLLAVTLSTRSFSVRRDGTVSSARGRPVNVVSEPLGGWWWLWIDVLLGHAKLDATALITQPSGRSTGPNFRRSAMGRLLRSPRRHRPSFCYG